MNKSIVIDEVKFFKASKKLLNQLNSKHNLEIKLNQLQEVLATSLGFRNLNALQSVFSSTEDLKTVSVKSQSSESCIFQNIEHDQALQIILNLMNKDEEDMWKGRCVSLISTVLSVLIHMRNEKELILDSFVISEHLNLDDIIKIYKTRKYLPDNIKSEIKSYLNSLPGYKDDLDINVSQNDMVYEQHGFLQMQFVKVLVLLQKIEKNNFIIADKSWFCLYKKERVLSASGGGGKNGEVKVKTEITEHLGLKESLHDLADDSWIVMPEYEEYINHLDKNKKLINIKISDLLIYTTKIIPNEKKKRMYCLLNSIVNNYSVAFNISKSICSKIKDN